MATDLTEATEAGYAAAPSALGSQVRAVVQAVAPIIRRQLAKEIAAAIRASDVTWSGPGVAPDSGSWAIEVDDAVAIVERIGAK